MALMETLFWAKSTERLRILLMHAYINFMKDPNDGSLERGDSDRDKRLIIDRHGGCSVAVGWLRLSGLLYYYSWGA